MANWQSGDVVVNGLRLHYTRTGGDKPPFVLAHGFSDDGLCWTPVARQLEADYDVVMIDRALSWTVRGGGHRRLARRKWPKTWPGSSASWAWSIPSSWGIRWAGRPRMRWPGRIRICRARSSSRMPGAINMGTTDEDRAKRLEERRQWLTELQQQDA